MKPNIRIIAPLLAKLVRSAFQQSSDHAAHVHALVKRETSHHSAGFVVQAVLIPVLVILSGILAGLTLGYMSLDETQLRVLSVSGTPKQRAYAKRIEPIRKNGHLLLTTLLLGNMVVNETLPVISENVLGGGVQAVIVSTVLIVIFSEIIPQSLCSRFGLQIGAWMAVPTQWLIYFLFVIAWPIAKLLEFALGPHHGIIYRRNELKELINMHSAMEHHGGDLQGDTVAMVGGALDFQEKTVFDAMTPIADVFMLNIETRLDYQTLAQVVRSGHSRVPVYEEVKENNGQVSKNIIGVLLVKQCILLDPEDATPLRDIPLNTVPNVPYDESLLSTLDRFQLGKSHMAVVSRIPSRTESKTKPGSINEDAKVGLTRRFLNRVGLGDTDSESDSSSDENESERTSDDGSKKRMKREEREAKKAERKERKELAKTESKDSRLGANSWKQWNRLNELEQTMPADAVLPNDNAQEFLNSLQRAPLGIITLEDVLEELIGEEILDEFDLKGADALPASSYVPEEAQRAVDAAKALKANLSKEKPVAVPPPTASRVAQGIRAIRLATSSTVKTVGEKNGRSGVATPDPALLPFPPPSNFGAPVEEKTVSIDSNTTAAAPEDPVAKLAAITSAPLGMTPPTGTLRVPGVPTRGEGIANPASSTPSLNIPISRGGSKGAKKRVFKSPLAGEGATPGLERRVDPMLAVSASATTQKTADETRSPDESEGPQG